MGEWHRGAVLRSGLFLSDLLGLCRHRALADRHSRFFRDFAWQPEPEPRAAAEGPGQQVDRRMSASRQAQPVTPTVPAAQDTAGQAGAEPTAATEPDRLRAGVRGGARLTRAPEVLSERHRPGDGGTHVGYPATCTLAPESIARNY